MARSILILLYRWDSEAVLMIHVSILYMHLLALPLPVSMSKNLLIRTSAMSVVSQLKKDLPAWFEMKDLGVANFCLGLEITRDCPKRLFHLCQSFYTMSISSRPGTSDVNSVHAPRTQQRLDLSPLIHPLLRLP